MIFAAYPVSPKFPKQIISPVSDSNHSQSTVFPHFFKDLSQDYSPLGDILAKLQLQDTKSCPPPKSRPNLKISLDPTVKFFMQHNPSFGVK